MEEIVAALSEQQQELADLLIDADLELPWACAGWTIGDVVVHLAHTNDLAIASAEGRPAAVAAVPAAGAIDDGADAAVARERGTQTPAELVTACRRATPVSSGPVPTPRRCSTWCGPGPRPARRPPSRR